LPICKILGVFNAWIRKAENHKNSKQQKKAVKMKCKLSSCNKSSSSGEMLLFQIFPKGKFHFELLPAYFLDEAWKGVNVCSKRCHSNRSKPVEGRGILEQGLPNAKFVLLATRADVES